MTKKDAELQGIGVLILPRVWHILKHKKKDGALSQIAHVSCLDFFVVIKKKNKRFLDYFFF